MPSRGGNGRLLALGLGKSLVAPNAQLRVLNPHVGSALTGAIALPVQLARPGSDGAACGGVSLWAMPARSRRGASGHSRCAARSRGARLRYRRSAFGWHSPAVASEEGQLSLYSASWATQPAKAASTVFSPSAWPLVSSESSVPPGWYWRRLPAWRCRHAPRGSSTVEGALACSVAHGGARARVRQHRAVHVRLESALSPRSSWLASRRRRGWCRSRPAGGGLWHGGDVLPVRLSLTAAWALLAPASSSRRCAW